MRYSDEFKRCLETLDTAAARKLWRHVSPHLPQPKTETETLLMLHRARTESESMPFKARAYSHRWLEDNGFPSGLPDNLKPNADRLYPKVESAVGIAVKALSSVSAPAVPLIRGAMEDAVWEAKADGRLTDDDHVRKRIQEARKYITRKLFG